MNLAKRRSRREGRAAVGLEEVIAYDRVRYGSDCGSPDTMKIVAKSITLAAQGMAGDEGTVSITTPGAFCPSRMYVIASADLDDSFIGSIRSGLDQQMIAGQQSPQISGPFVPLTAQLFDIGNNCCPVLCLPCICQPAVPFEVAIANGEPMSQTFTVILFGTYLDASDPRYAVEPGCPPRFLSQVNAPGCPSDGGDKILPFSPGLVGAGDEVIVRLETSGRFCPRQMFFESNNSDFFQVTMIRSGIKHQIIQGTLPANLFTINNECCTLACFDCMCKPGYPLFIGLRNTDAEAPRPIFGALIGSYEDACP